MLNRIDNYSGKTFSLYLRQPRQSLNLGACKISVKIVPATIIMSNPLNPQRLPAENRGNHYMKINKLKKQPFSLDSFPLFYLYFLYE